MRAQATAFARTGIRAGDEAFDERSATRREPIAGSVGDADARTAPLNETFQGPESKDPRYPLRYSRPLASTPPGGTRAQVSMHGPQAGSAHAGPGPTLKKEGRECHY